MVTDTLILIVDQDDDRYIPSAGARTPALAYLMNLRSAQSRVTMRSYLKILARKLGYSRLEECSWQDLTRQHVLALIEALQMDGLAPNTINTYLAGIKGVAVEARSLRLMDTDNFPTLRRSRGSGATASPKDVHWIVGRSNV